MRLRLTLAAILFAGAAACVAPKPEPTPAPPSATPSPRPTPAPAPAPIAPQTTWMDAPQTPGDWRYTRLATGSRAQFGQTAGAPIFSIQCNLNNRTIELTRAGPFSANTPMILRAESASRSLTGVAAADGAGLRTVLQPNDPMLDAIAFSKGRFAVEAAGAAAAYIPSWPEITRVIEDCR